MNLAHLTDAELIQWIIKHDSDPVRVRLAKYMDDRPGYILKQLEQVGMDPETCLFENTYDPGDWIRHLNNEVEYLSHELNVTLLKLEEREAMTLVEFIGELEAKIRASENRAQRAETEKRIAEEEVRVTRDKMKVWRAISTDLSK